ncbi:hypothetical protein DNTS_004118, partial [Danionella cerebrum]
TLGKIEIEAKTESREAFLTQRTADGSSSTDSLSRVLANPGDGEADVPSAPCAETRKISSGAREYAQQLAREEKKRSARCCAQQTKSREDETSEGVTERVGGNTGEGLRDSPPEPLTVEGVLKHAYTAVTFHENLRGVGESNTTVILRKIPPMDKDVSQGRRLQMQTDTHTDADHEIGLPDRFEAIREDRLSFTLPLLLNNISHEIDWPIDPSRMWGGVDRNTDKHRIEHIALINIKSAASESAGFSAIHFKTHPSNAPEAPAEYGGLERIACREQDKTCSESFLHLALESCWCGMQNVQQQHSKYQTVALRKNGRQRAVGQIMQRSAESCRRVAKFSKSVRVWIEKEFQHSSAECPSSRTDSCKGSVGGVGGGEEKQETMRERERVTLLHSTGKTQVWDFQRTSAFQVDERHTLIVGSLTIKMAMAPPMMKPAMTSAQWLRYSTTRLIPVRKARHISPRDSTGLASFVPLAFTEQVIAFKTHPKYKRIVSLTERCKVRWSLAEDDQILGSRARSVLLWQAKGAYSSIFASACIRSKSALGDGHSDSLNERKSSTREKSHELGLRGFHSHRYLKGLYRSTCLRRKDSKPR